MKTYKVVPFSGTVVLHKDELPQEGIARHFEIINQECVDGWEFVTVTPISVTTPINRFKHRQQIYQAFVFSKEIVTEIEDLDD